MFYKRLKKNPFGLAIILTAALLLALLAENLFGFLKTGEQTPAVDMKAVLRRIKEAELTPREALYYEVIRETTHGPEKNQ
jgi:hypothetical protein